MWQLALLATLAAPVELETVWTRYMEADFVQAIDKYLLLRSEGANYTLLECATGQTVGRLENVSQARITSGRIVLARGSGDEPTAVEGWTIEPFEIAWSMPISEPVSLGEIVDDTFIFATRHALFKVALPNFDLLDQREWTNTRSNYRNHSVRASSTRVFFGRGPEVFGLSINDFSRGWRNYCGAWPQVVDENGFVGTGRIWHPLVIVGNDGKTVTYEETIQGGYTFYRNTIGVTKDVVVATGYVGRSASTPTHHEYRVISSYLFAFDRRTGKEIWRKPMGASDPVVVENRVLHLARNKVRGHIELTMQICELRTGKLLWKSKPIDSEARIDLFGNDEMAFELTTGRVRALRIKG
jgi:outer membrane protein assembly factor BamB